MPVPVSDSLHQPLGQGPLLSVSSSPPPEAMATSDPSLLRNVVRAPGRMLGRILRFFVDAFGLLVLFLALALVSAIPGLQFFGLGFLLDTGGRVAKTGRIRDGFIGLGDGARLGMRAIAAAVVLLPAYIVSSLRQSAMIIDPAPSVARNWTIFLGVLTGLALLQLSVAFAEGGRLRDILIPAVNPRRIYRNLSREGYCRARDAFWSRVGSFQLPYLFWLGVRGFAGGVLWVALPATLLAIPPQIRPINLIGFVLASIASCFVPLMQTRLAAENRLRGMIEVTAVLERFRRAPWEFLIALVATLLLATPLYLIKIFQFPPDLAWLASFLFLISLYPARLLAGWAYARGDLQRPVRLFLFRWSAALLMLAASLVYSIMVFLTRYATWDGWWSLYEQHAFLIQVPLFWSHP